MGTRILALDPGITTGIAILDDGIVITSHFEGSHRQFYDWLDELNPEAIIYESFVYQRRDKVELYPVEVIGIIKLWADSNGIPAFRQSPAQAKGLFDDDKLKKMGLWKKGYRHGMDATRHLMYHLVVTRGETLWLNALNPDS